MPAPISISAQTARRFVLGKQGLWPGRRWAGLEGTRQAMLAGEYVQLDPLGILARSHDIVLHSRIEAYDPAHFETLTYERGEFFEWGGWLAVRPMDELPYWRTIMRRERDHEGMRHIAAEYGDVIDQMRKELRDRGTVANADFASDGPALDHYRGGKPSSLALYYLWRTGEAMTHHRERFLRVYAPAEAIAPADLLTEAPDDEADRFLVRKSVAFAGIGRAGRIGMPLSRLLARTVARSEQAALEQSLVDARELVSVEVEGMRGPQFVVTEDVPAIETLARGGVPPGWEPLAPGPQVALLSPLDPVSARGRAKALFGFDYLWEIYLPAEKVISAATRSPSSGATPWSAASTSDRPPGLRACRQRPLVRSGGDCDGRAQGRGVPGGVRRRDYAHARVRRREESGRERREARAARAVQGTVAPHP